MVKEGQLVELVGDQSPSLEASPVAGEEGAMEMSREKRGGVRVIERKEVGGDHPIEYFLPMGSEVLLEFQIGDYN